MKIGFDAKRAFHNNSGLGNYSRDLINILSFGLTKDSFVLFNPYENSRKFNFNKKNTIEITPRGLWNNFGSLWRSFEIAKLAHKEGLTLYHGLSNELPNGLKNIKSIVTIHDLIFERFPEWYKPIDRKIYRQKFKSAAQKADVVVAISEQTKSDLINYYQISSEKIIVVYQGCHSAFKQPVHKELNAIVRRKFKLPKEFILSVGTIEPRKNLLTIVKAIQNQPEVNLVVVGRETKYASEVKSFLLANQMEDRVFFLKNVNMSELAGIYQMATLFVYPSQFEGFGIPIIEALFSKVPVITSTGSCFREAGGPNSKYLPYNDVEAWAKAIKSLYKDDESKQRMSENGYEYVQKFQDDQILENWKSIYNSFR